MKFEEEKQGFKDTVLKLSKNDYPGVILLLQFVARGSVCAIDERHMTLTTVTDIINGCKNIYGSVNSEFVVAYMMNHKDELLESMCEGDAWYFTIKKLQPVMLAIMTGMQSPTGLDKIKFSLALNAL